MKASPAASLMIVLSFGVPASAHRLDEYLQATTISIEKGRVRAQLRLTPGVSVAPFVLSIIDGNGDGVLSAREQRAYAKRVLRDLSLTVDGDVLELRLISANFPETDELKAGIGEIHMDFAAAIPHDGAERKLLFENRHQSPISAYLVNCLMPQDREIQVTAQHRNYEQSRYLLDYVQGGVRPGLLSLAWWTGGGRWLASAAIVLCARLALSRRSRPTRF